MPFENVHRRQAEHNKRFLDWLNLDVTPYLDWAVTVMFYTALHLVEWLLATKGYHSDSHENRHQAMGRVSELRRSTPIIVNSKLRATEADTRVCSCLATS